MLEKRYFEERKFHRIFLICDCWSRVLPESASTRLEPGSLPAKASTYTEIINFKFQNTIPLWYHGSNAAQPSALYTPLGGTCEQRCHMSLAAAKCSGVARYNRATSPWLPC